MAKRPTINTVSSGYNSLATLNSNFTKIQEAFDNTLSRDGSTPNAMNADLDMNNKDILNAKDVYSNSVITDRMVVGGVSGNFLTPAPNWRGVWITATSYSVNDLVHINSSTYICVTAHTSGTFTTDLSGGLWELFAYGVDIGRFDDTFSGDGSTVAFVLSQGVPTGGLVDVFVHGIRQESSAFSYVGDTVTFSEAPPFGTDNIVISVVGSAPTSIDASILPYTPSEAGAVTTSVAEKLGDFVTLEDFGGSPSVADNASAFQAAMTAGGRLYIPEGNIYNIKSAVTRSGGCHIWGGGILRWTSDAASYGLTVTLDATEKAAFHARFDGVQFQTEKAGLGSALTIDGTASTARREPPRVDISSCVFRGATDPSANGWEHNIVLTGIVNAFIERSTIVGFVVGTSPQPNYAGDGIRADDVINGAHLSITSHNSFYLTNHVWVDGYEGVYMNVFNLVGGTTGVRSINSGVGDFPHMSITNGHMNILNDCVNLTDTTAVFIGGNLLWQGANTATNGTAIRLVNCNDVSITNNNLRGGRALVDYYGILIGGTSADVQITDNLGVDCIYLAWAQAGTDRIYAYNNRTKRENTNAYFTTWGDLYANTSGGNEVIFDGESHSEAFAGTSTGITGAYRRANRFTYGGDYEPTRGQLGHPAPNTGNSWQNALQVTRGTLTNPDTTALYARTAVYVEMHSGKAHSVNQCVWGNSYKSPALTVENTASSTFEGEANGAAFRAYSTATPAGATANQRNLVGVSAIGQTNTGAGNNSWSVWGANFIAAETSGNVPDNCVGIEVDINHQNGATSGVGPSAGNNYTGYWAQSGAQGVYSTAAFYSSRTASSLGWNYHFYSTTAARDWAIYLVNPSTVTAASGIHIQTAAAAGTALEASTAGYNTTSGNGPNVMSLKSQASGVSQTQMVVTSNASNPVNIRVGGDLETVLVGAADSGGVGYRMLRVAN
jgi:hypothetical protein